MARAGRSRTHTGEHGRVLMLTNPMDKGYLCARMCLCQNTKLLGKAGQQLRQRCTTKAIWADEEANQLVWGYKAEVGYNMRTNPPSPIMSAEQPNRASRFPLGRAIGEGILKRDLEGRFQKGLLRIPDCIVLKIKGPELAAMRASGHIDWKRLIPIQANIDTVVEIKFDGDTLSDRQRKAYQKIAGPNKFRLLKASSCDCDKKRQQPQTEPVRNPVTTPMKVESTQERRWYQIVPDKPKEVPAPQPKPQPETLVAKEGEGVPLSTYLKNAALVGGCVLVVGAIAILAAPAEAAVGLVLLGAGAAANAKESNPKNKDKKS